MESELLNKTAPTADEASQTETANDAEQTTPTNVVPLKPLTPLLDDDLLVEEVCIDGMCGVY